MGKQLHTISGNLTVHKISGGNYFRYSYSGYIWIFCPSLPVLNCDVVLQGTVKELMHTTPGMAAFQW